MNVTILPGINRAEVLSSGRQPHKVQAMFLGVKETWYEYGTIKRLRRSQPTASQSATRSEKIAKKNKLKIFQNTQSTYQGMSRKLY